MNDVPAEQRRRRWGQDRVMRVSAHRRDYFKKKRTTAAAFWKKTTVLAIRTQRAAVDDVAPQVFNHTKTVCHTYTCAKKEGTHRMKSILEEVLAALFVLSNGHGDDDDDDDDDDNNETNDDQSQLHVLAAHGALETMRLLLEHGSVRGQLVCAIDKVLSLLLVGESLVDVVLHDAGHLINLPLDLRNTIRVGRHDERIESCLSNDKKQTKVLYILIFQDTFCSLRHHPQRHLI